MRKTSNHRIVIIGAGPAGCSCAIALLMAGVGEVMLVDAAKRRKFDVGESIPPDMNLVFKQLGIYKAFLSEGHEPCYGSRSYWGNHRHGYNDTILSPHGNGWHLDRARFNVFLAGQVRGSGGKVVEGYTYLSSYQTGNEHILAVVNAKGEKIALNANFVVDATGTRGVFAADKGSRKNAGTSLLCLGLRFQLMADDHIAQLTHLESVADGWWYATRIPGKQLLVTFYTNAETVKTLELQQVENWMTLLNAAPHTSELVEGCSLYDHKLFGFQAYSFCLDKIVGDRWMAIGDAASTYDPITSQGIFKSVSQGVSAAKCITNSIDSGIEVFTDFEQNVHDEYRHYQEVRKQFYQLEQRWPSHNFWKVMHGL